MLNHGSSLEHQTSSKLKYIRNYGNDGTAIKDFKLYLNNLPKPDKKNRRTSYKRQGTLQGTNSSASPSKKSKQTNKIH